jgi:hypothetical protein
VKANKTATERAADILVAEFSELTTKELVTVFNTLKKDDGISLFLAIDRDMRVMGYVGITCSHSATAVLSAPFLLIYVHIHL